MNNKIDLTNTLSNHSDKRMLYLMIYIRLYCLSSIAAIHTITSLIVLILMMAIQIKYMYTIMIITIIIVVGIIIGFELYKETQKYRKLF